MCTLQGLDKLGARGPFGADKAAVQTAPDLATVMTSESAAQSHDVPGVKDSRCCSCQDSAEDHLAQEMPTRGCTCSTVPAKSFSTKRVVIDNSEV